jgi:hypothetical protein
MATTIRIDNKLYAGGGTDGILTTALASSSVVSSGTEVLKNGGADRIRVHLACTASGKACKLRMTQFSEEVLAVGKVIETNEITITSTDLTATTDRSSFGLVAGTEIYLRNPQDLEIVPYAFTTFNLSSTDGDCTWILRLERYNSNG